MAQPILLIAIALVVALVDWLKSTPKPGEPWWPRWIKLTCAVAVGVIGIVGLFDGYFARNRGLKMYKENYLVEAVAELSKAAASPFGNRTVLDHLGLAYKNLADRATEIPVMERYYGKALECFLDSRAKYPQEIFALNNMINIYRRLHRWEEVERLVESCRARLAVSGELLNDGQALSPVNRGTLLVTIGNVYADDLNPNFAPEIAIGFYREALKYDPNNSFVRLNLPVRLLQVSKKIDDSNKRILYLQEAYDLAARWYDYIKDINKVFSLVNVVDVLSEPDISQLKVNRITIKHAIDEILNLHNAWIDSEYETWIVLGKAYINIGEHKHAEEYLNRAMIYKARFTPEQNKAYHDLQSKISTSKGNKEGK
jgi:tetratricopeptide (TPR) repeat protein